MQILNKHRYHTRKPIKCGCTDKETFFVKWQKTLWLNKDFNPVLLRRLSSLVRQKSKLFSLCNSYKKEDGIFDFGKLFCLIIDHLQTVFCLIQLVWGRLESFFLDSILSVLSVIKKKERRKTGMHAQQLSSKEKNVQHI